MRTFAKGLTGLLGFFLLWEITVQAGVLPDYWVPPASEVATTFVELLGDREFLLGVVATLLAWLIALGVAIGIGVPAGLLLGSVPALQSASRALIEFLRPIPAVALIPLVMVTIGSGPDAKITLAVYAAVWPILFNTIYAFGEIDPVLLDSARATGANRRQALTWVALPHAAPFIFTGVRVAASIALIAVISVEYIAASEVGLGRYILEGGMNNGHLDQVMAGTVLAGLAGWAINSALVGSGKRLFRWADTEERATR
ncbi:MULTISPECIES: ABC transporter permease [Prauserella salsuginis group]|uniref:NitT/TauT family transport system permease protein n=2 Tax=Prauserella salsuginis group TaxID=2893672 RepID=A0A839XS43_9PSEU|nr:MULTISPECIES: ABC transporter permease [Prauserella salsuginis group]MBB3663443.1 NitT/TauT family transport system permease protein [Prauserella sediminis]MCR3720737.1 NitT/TauT family transport system permease protein [Prauserella flava]MCR3735182.1 NitT/TauT family transport system permease protein [Prauserella salsuginis]